MRRKDEFRITHDDIGIFIRFLFVLWLFISLLLILTTDDFHSDEPQETTSIITAIPQEYLVAKPVTSVAMEVVETPVAEEPVPYLIDVTDEDIDLMARVVMSEASVLNFECKQAIAQTIVNRVRSSKFPNTVSKVINQKYQYSTQNNGKPNADCYAAVQQALRYTEWPEDMYYFRMWKYHRFGTPLMEIDDCYFSTQ